MLVCKECGYKQRDDDCVEEFSKRFPKTETHDIPYYCGACMDNASDEAYKEMMKEMEGAASDTRNKKPRNKKRDRGNAR